MAFEVVWDAAGIVVYRKSTMELGENVIRTAPPPFTSPCKASEYLNQLANQSDGALVPQERDTMALIADLCRQSKQAGAPPPPPPKPKPTPAKAVPDVPPSPNKADTPQSLGAPDVPATAVVARQPTETQGVADRPADQHFDQYQPKPADQAIVIAAPPAATNEQLQDLTSRVLQNRPLPEKPHPNLTGEKAQAPPAGGDPVDLCTGAFTLAVTDLEVPTTAIPIRLIRRYRSGRPYFGPFGFGWDHSYNIYLRALADGAMALWMGALWEYRFNRAGADYQPQRGLAAALTRVSGLSDVYEVRHPQGLVWRFERPAGWSHAEHIPLTSIRDRHGNVVALTYDASNRLAAVADEAGRGLRFGYGHCGLLEYITDHAGARRVRYIHAAEIEHLIRVILPPTAGHADGMHTDYDYDAENPHPAMRHNILRVRDTQDRVSVENTYAGPEAGWAFNAVVRQIASDFEFRFDYECVQYVPASEVYRDIAATRTIVRPPDGSMHVHTFNYRGELLDYRFRLNLDRSGRVVAMAFAYDEEGNPSETLAPDGVRTVRTFDTANPDPCARRNLLRVELTAPVAGLLPSRVVFAATYDAVYQLPRTQRDELGAETRFVYDFDLGIAAATGLLRRVELPAVTFANGSTQQSIFVLDHDARGQLTAITSPGGGRTEIVYLGAGAHEGFVHRVIEDTAGARLTTEYSYDAAGYPASVSEPGPRVSLLRHNALGLLEERISPAVAGVATPTRQFFDDSGSLVRVERPRGAYTDALIAGDHIVDEYLRDVLGAVTHARLASNTEHPREWRQIADWRGKPLESWDGAGMRSRWQYDERGLLVRHRYASNPPQEARFSYDRAGRLWRSVDAAGRETTHDYDAWGRLQRVVLPNGSTRRLQWGPADRLLEVQIDGDDGPGTAIRPLSKTTYTYDERGRRRTETQWSFTTVLAAALPLVTEFHYDADDNLQSVTRPRGTRFTFGYDALGRSSQVTDDSGNTRTLAYGPNGNVSVVTATQSGPAGPQSTTRSYGYDERGRLATAQADGAIRRLVYDDRDLLAAETDPLGRITQFTNGPHGELAAKRRDAAGLGQPFRWTYDGSGRASGFVDAGGEATVWVDDPATRSRRMQLADASLWTRTSSPNGMAQLLPSGSRIALTFGGEAGRPTAMSCVAGAGVTGVADHTFVYDGLGRLVRAANETGAVTREYDSLNRLVAESANGKTTRAEYDDATGDIDLIFPDGRRERTSTDTHGRPTRVVLVQPGALGGSAGDLLLEMSYGSSGEPVSWLHGNGVRSSFVHDEGGRLIRIEHTLGATVLEACRTRYDAAGHRAVVQLTGAPERTTLHAFDSLDRLVEARWSQAPAALPDVRTSAEHQAQIAAIAASLGAAAARDVYSVDLSDVRQARTLGGVTALYTYDSGHLLVDVDGAAITYDADGHRRSDDRFAYDVDVLGRVVRVRDVAGGAIRATFAYDALSRPVSGTFDGVAFSRSFFGAGWVEESRGATATARQQSPRPDGTGPFLVLDSTGAYYVHHDDALTTLCVTDASGQVRERHRHDAFGVLARFAADGVTPVATSVVDARWRGMGLVGATGLYATPRRLYDPSFGVFLSRDRLLYADSPSPYVFAAHNPVDFADPTGLSKTPIGRGSDNAEEHGETWKWFHQQTRIWHWEPHYEGDILPQVGSVETGSLLLDYFANYQNSVYNVMASWINLPFRTLAGVDRLIMNSQFALLWMFINDTLPLERMPLMVAESIAYASALISRARIMARLTEMIGAVRVGATANVASESLPMARLHYSPYMAVEPGHANWMRCNLEWVMEEIGYFIKGDRNLIPEEKGLRRLARKFMEKIMDLEGLQAGHPIDEVAGAMFRRKGEVGSTYYFMEENVNREYGVQLGSELNRLGVKVGERFGIIFEGNWPSYLEHPPMAPPASPPNLGRP